MAGVTTSSTKSPTSKTRFVGEKRWVSRVSAVLAWAMGLLFFFPVLWMVATSFKTEGSAQTTTIPVWVTTTISTRGQFLAKLSASSTLACLPVLIAGWAAQKRLVRGLTMGAIK
jgi:ABC-type glycerol-3-phosphate transport system permease component